MPRWSLSLALEPRSRTPLPAQIARALASAIRSGRLRSGALVPGSRSLARSLGVSRNTVAAAYEELQAEGWLSTSGPRGTFVSRRLPEPRAREFAEAPAAQRWHALGYALASSPSVDDELPATPPGVLRWDFGVPDARLAPAAELARAYRRALRDPATLQYARYAPPAAPLATALAEMLAATRGLAVRAENVLVTRGSQMAIDLVARALLEPGDLVAVEDPGYELAWQSFRAMGARLVPIPVDHEGLRVDLLERALASRPIRAIFVTPHRQFPTTVSLSARRRLELLRLAARHRAAIIEDDFDHELHYDGRPILPLAAADAHGVVAYVGSLSKTLGPGLRVGYLVAPVPLVARATSIRTHVDLEGDPALERAVAELIQDGDVLRCINRARRVYRARRDFLVDALRRELGGALELAVPSGGMALWAKVDPAIDPERWARNAAANGLLVRTAAPFYATRAGPPALRLGFARLDEAELSEALQRLVASLPRPRSAPRRTRHRTRGAAPPRPRRPRR